MPEQRKLRSLLWLLEAATASNIWSVEGGREAGDGAMVAFAFGV